MTVEKPTLEQLRMLLLYVDRRRELGIDMEQEDAARLAASPVALAEFHRTFTPGKPVKQRLPKPNVKGLVTVTDIGTPVTRAWSALMLTPILVVAGVVIAIAALGIWVTFAVPPAPGEVGADAFRWLRGIVKNTLAGLGISIPGE